MSRLLAKGYIVGLAPENTQAVDLIAMHEDGTRSFQIQVKTRTQGRALDKGWHMKDKHEHVDSQNLYYIFVTLPERWTDKDQPETFIIPSAKVAQVLKRSHHDWHSTPGARGQQRNDTKMRRLLPRYNDSPSIPSDWMERYRDNWSFLG